MSAGYAQAAATVDRALLPAASRQETGYSVRHERPPDYPATRAALELVSGLSRPAVVEMLRIALTETDVMPAVAAALEDVQRWWR